MKILGFSPLDHDSLSDIYLCPTTLFQDTFTRHCFSLFQSILWFTFSFQFISVQSLSHVWIFATPWIAACHASLSITNSWSLLKLMSVAMRCHPTISSSVIPFSCLQSFPAWGSFPMSQLFTSGGQSTGVSASASVLPMNRTWKDWFL